MRKNELMNQEAFKGAIIKRLEEVYEANYRIEVSQIIKNNYTFLHGLYISVSGEAI